MHGLYGYEIWSNMVAQRKNVVWFGMLLFTVEILDISIKLRHSFISGIKTKIK